MGSFRSMCLLCDFRSEIVKKIFKHFWISEYFFSLWVIFQQISVTNSSFYFSLCILLGFKSYYWVKINKLFLNLYLMHEIHLRLIEQRKLQLSSTCSEKYQKKSYSSTDTWFSVLKVGIRFIHPLMTILSFVYWLTRLLSRQTIQSIKQYSSVKHTKTKRRKKLSNIIIQLTEVEVISNER